MCKLLPSDFKSIWFWFRFRHSFFGFSFFKKKDEFPRCLVIFQLVFSWCFVHLSFSNYSDLVFELASDDSCRLFSVYQTSLWTNTCEHCSLLTFPSDKISFLHLIWQLNCCQHFIHSFKTNCSLSLACSLSLCFFLSACAFGFGLCPSILPLHLDNEIVVDDRCILNMTICIFDKNSYGTLDSSPQYASQFFLLNNASFFFLLVILRINLC